MQRYGLIRQNVSSWHEIGEAEELAFLKSASESGNAHILDPSAYRFALAPVAERTLNSSILKKSFEGALNINGTETPVLFAPYSDEMRANSCHAKNDRHLTRHFAPLAATLEQIDLTGMNVLDIGFGTGYVSHLILKQDVNRLLAYDIQKPNPEQMVDGVLDDPRFEPVISDYRMDDLSFIADGNWAIIANPPYKLITDIRRTIIDPLCPEGVIMISSQWRTRDFPGYNIEQVQTGADFTPAALGLHFIISDGFAGRWQRSTEEKTKERLTILGKDHYPRCPSDELNFDPYTLKEIYDFDW